MLEREDVLRLVSANRNRGPENRINPSSSSSGMIDLTARVHQFLCISGLPFHILFFFRLADAIILSDTLYIFHVLRWPGASQNSVAPSVSNGYCYLSRRRDATPSLADVPLSCLAPSDCILDSGMLEEDSA
jgi:hypothetical protein